MIERKKPKVNREEGGAMPLGRGNEKMDPLLTPKELSERLQVKPGTIYSWISRGVNIPHVRIEGTLRFREKAIQDWILAKETERKRKNFEI